jgi:ABC-type sugar transport system permease subunit
MEKPKKTKKHLSLKAQHAKWAWVFLAPWLLGIAVFFVWPMAQSVIYSFSRLTITANGFQLDWVGADNYSYLFTKDTFFLPNLTQALGDVIPSVLMITAFSLFIAVILKEKFVGRSAARTVFFFPVMIASGVIITILKEQVMMSVSTGDDTAAYLFQAPDLVSTFASFGLPDFVLTSITDIVNGFFDLTWKSGVQMLLLLSAINNIPQSFYEAAVLDGAGAWVKFWKITFPAITPSLLVVIIYTVIDSFLDYDNLVMSMIRDYYQNNNYTYSATIGVIYFVCILAFVGLVSLVMRKLVVYMYQ